MVACMQHEAISERTFYHFLSPLATLPERTAAVSKGVFLCVGVVSYTLKALREAIVILWE